MSFAIITSRPNFVGRLNSGRDCSRRLCRPLTSDAYSGSAKQLFQRGVVFLGAAAILFVVGALLTGLGYYAVLTHVARALGPMCIAMAMLLVIVAARYITISRRLHELAEIAECQEISGHTDQQEDGHRSPRDTGMALIPPAEAQNSNQNMNETYGFRFQPADFLPPPTYDCATHNESQETSRNRPSSRTNIPLSEQEPPPPYTDAIKTSPHNTADQTPFYTEK